MNMMKYFPKITYVYLLMLCGALSYLSRRFVDNRVLIKPETMRLHHKLLQKYYEARKDWTVSNLGKCLFKFSSTRPPTCEVINHPELIHPDSNLFHILIWRHEGSTKRRHMDGSGKHGKDPLRGCSVQNCRFTENDDSWIPFVDAVVVHLNKALLPNWQQQSKRKPHQRWIFWTEEPPVYTFSGAEPGTVKPRLKDMANIFNWSMTYRSDSDIPVPYGRTIPLLYPKFNDIHDAKPSDLVPYWSRKQTKVLATILMSRCFPFRMNFVTQLQKFLYVDFYGGCSKVPGHIYKCPGNWMADCPVLEEYLFYLAIENSMCRQYISEKVFHHAYSKGAIPIIMGIPLVDCIKLLPPHSFLHVDSFPSLKELSNEVNSVRNNMSKLLEYHAWRVNFEVVEELGFQGTRSWALCRVCEALNYNSNANQNYGIEDIMLYLDPAVCCSKNLK